MMGAAMLKRHQFVWSLWALYRLVVSSITFVRHLYVGESGAALVTVSINLTSIQIHWLFVITDYSISQHDEFNFLNKYATVRL